MSSLRDNSTTGSLTVWSATNSSTLAMAGVTWSYSPMITSRRMTATSAMIAFICKGSTEACYRMLLPAGLQLPASFQLESRASPSPPRGGQVTVPPQTHPCLFLSMLTLQPRHHICLRSCLALLLKAVALSDKLSGEGKNRGDSAARAQSEHPCVLLTPLGFKQ